MWEQVKEKKKLQLSGTVNRYHWYPRWDALRGPPIILAAFSQAHFKKVWTSLPDFKSLNRVIGETVRYNGVKVCLNKFGILGK